jgi:benzoate/toluate 1,2-dioxygenase beta subunit
MTMQNLATDLRDAREMLADFVHEEAELADQHRYEEWLALWNPQRALYLVPYGENGRGPQRVSLTRDDFDRLTARIARLRSGGAHSQDPPSSLCRVIGRVRPVKSETGAWVMTSSFICTEYRPGRDLIVWSGTSTHTVGIAPAGDRLELWRKEVRLVNIAADLPPLTFLI